MVRPVNQRSYYDPGFCKMHVLSETSAACNLRREFDL